MNPIITLRIPRPKFEEMNERVRDEIIQELSRQVAEQIYASELGRRQKQSADEFKEYLRRWDIEVLLAELKYGQSSTNTKEPE